MNHRRSLSLLLLILVPLLAASYDTDKTVSFIFLADLQLNDDDVIPNLVQIALTQAPDASLLILAGDIVNRGNRKSQWQKIFAHLKPLSDKMPILATPGNHEYMGFLPIERKLTSNWKKYIHQPENSSGVMGSFFMDLAGIRFVALNTNEALLPQLNWLKETINSPYPAILICHQPFYSEVRKPSKELSLLESTLADSMVKLVLTGHDHVYTRTHFLRHGSRPEHDSDGIVFLSSVSCSKFYRPQNPDKIRMAVSLEKTPCVVIGRIFQGALKLETRSWQNQVIDQVTILMKGSPKN